LCLRVAIASGIMSEAGEELGALIRRIEPGMPPIEPAADATAEAVALGPELFISREHVEHDDTYHAELREHLAVLFHSLCDSSLEDALDAARRERDRRAEGAN